MGAQEYVPNDIELPEQTDIQLITGPNMSGKSTYMRQFALTVIMAQIGSLSQPKQLIYQFLMPSLHGLVPVIT